MCSSDDSGSEEGWAQQLQHERVLQLARQRACGRKARQQMADLHAYRQQQLNQIGRWQSHCEQTSENTARLLPAAVPAAGELAQREEYEARWAAFEAQPPERVTCANIPWPPSATSLLSWLAADVQRADCEHIDQPTAGAARETSATATASAICRQRRAFRQASRRWHPDKFVARHGSRIAAADRPTVMAAVQALMQDINEASAAQLLA